VEENPERWYDPDPAASLGDAGGSAVPIETEPVNSEEGVPPARPRLGEDDVNPWGMSAGQHTQPWRFRPDEPSEQTSSASQNGNASSSRGTGSASEPAEACAGPSGRDEAAPPVPGSGPVRLSDGADARFKDTAVWRALCAFWRFLQKVNTTVIAVLWVAVLVFALIYVVSFVVRYVQLVLLRSAAGSAGVIARGGLA
jgi:hypothetical protein